MSRHKRHTCIQENNALAGKNDRIISATSASDKTDCTGLLRPSLEAIFVILKFSRAKHGEYVYIREEDWVQDYTSREILN